MKLEEIINSDKCYGCGACINSCKTEALKMKKNEKGFSYPELDKNKCVECNKCYNVCPTVHENLKKVFNRPTLQNTYSIRHRDDTVRLKSSSGGLFTALADYILKHDGVICGVVWNEDFSVKHICANTINDKDKMVQSKYIQSEIEYCFREIENYLKMGKKVLFTGTPCQVAGLKLFLKNKNLDNLFLCDVLCGGNVSPGFFQEYVKFIEKNRKDKVSSVCFRTKKLGWKQHHIRIILQNSEYEGARKNEEPFFSLYLKKYIIRDACFKCEFASKQRVSDITMGDFWGIEKKDPKIDDDKGISIAIVNTEKGQKLIDAIKNKIYIEKRDLDIAVPKQINLQRPPLKPREREKFWNDYVKKGSEYTLKKYTTFGLKEKVIVYLKRIVRRVRVK